MAVLITPNMTEIHDCDSTTGWSGGSTNAPDALEGSYCLAAQVKNTTSSIYLYTLSSAVDLTGKFIVMSMKVNGVADVIANGGYRIIIEDSSSNQSVWYVGGRDTHPGGWGYFAIDPSTTPQSGSADYTDVLKIGVQFKTLTSVVGTADNCFWDICHYGTGLTITSAASESGGSGNGGAVGWDDIFNYDTGNNPHYYGIVQKINGVYFFRGKLIFGDDSSLSIDFDDTALVGVLPDSKMTDAVTGIDILGNATGSSNVVMSNSVIFSTLRKFTIDAGDTDIDSFDLPSTTIQGADDSDLTMAELIATAFDSCDELTVGAAVFTDGVIRNSPDTEALVYPTTDNLERISFIPSGTGHAIIINSTGSYYFDGHTFDGYASVDGSTGNECVYNNSGGAVTIYVQNGGDTPTIHNGSGASTTVIVNPVTLSVTVKDIVSGTELENARVLVYVTNGTNFPYKDSVSITGSGYTATVTHTAHGLDTGDYVIIEGVTNDDDYNGCYQITKINDNSYSYTATETLDSSPATGTITATFAYIYGLTDSNGEISDSRSISADQAVAGWARKADGSPYFYVEGSISATVDKDSGVSIIIQLVRDE